MVASIVFADTGVQPAGLSEIESLFSNIVSISVGAALIALIIVLVIAGFKFLTSGGEAKALHSASQTATWGFLGILFLIIAWLILQLIAGFTGLNILKSFDIKVDTNNTNNSARSRLLSIASVPFDSYGDRIILTSPRYQVLYQPPFDLFMLTVYDTPIEQIRLEAENDLLQKAGGDLQGLCSLNFKLVAPSFVTGGDSGEDYKLALCKQVLSASTGQNRFLSDKPIITTENFPTGVYVSLCRENGTSAEGVWQVADNRRAANFLYNQENTRCGDPTPNHLIFTQPVPKGSYLVLCQSDKEPPSEWVWQVNKSGKQADFLYNQDGCTGVPPITTTPPPTSNSLKFTPVTSCDLGTGYCSVDYLKPYFGDNVINASKICNKESHGNPALVSPTQDYGLFQISKANHEGKPVEYWFNPQNNIKKAVAMSGGGVNWASWSTAYQTVCWADNSGRHKASGCGLIHKTLGASQCP